MYRYVFWTHLKMRAHNLNVQKGNTMIKQLSIRNLTVGLLFGLLSQGVAATHLASQHAENVDLIDHVFTSGGGTFDGNLTPAASMDWFNFGAVVGDVVTIETLAIAGQFDTGLSLILGTVAAGDGPINTLNSLAEDDDGGAGLLSKIVYNITATGDYAIGLGGFGSNLGNYRVSLAGNTGTHSSVPLPAAWLLLSTGLVLLGLRRNSERS